MDVGINNAGGEIFPLHIHSGTARKQQCRLAVPVAQLLIVKDVADNAVFNKNPPFKGETFVYNHRIFKNQLCHYFFPLILRNLRPITPQNASPNMLLLILETPAVRSTNITETSAILKPSL